MRQVYDITQVSTVGVKTEQHGVEDDDTFTEMLLDMLDDPGWMSLTLVRRTER